MDLDRAADDSFTDEGVVIHALSEHGTCRREFGVFPLGRKMFRIRDRFNAEIENIAPWAPCPPWLTSVD